MYCPVCGFKITQIYSFCPCCKTDIRYIYPPNVYNNVSNQQDNYQLNQQHQTYQQNVYPNTNSGSQPHSYSFNKITIIAVTAIVAMLFITGILVTIKVVTGEKKNRNNEYKNNQYVDKDTNNETEQGFFIQSEENDITPEILPFRHISDIEAGENLVDLVDGKYIYELKNGYYVKLNTDINNYISSDNKFDFYGLAEDLGYITGKEALRQGIFDVSRFSEDNRYYSDLDSGRVYIWDDESSFGILPCDNYDGKGGNTNELSVTYCKYIQMDGNYRWHNIGNTSQSCYFNNERTDFDYYTEFDFIAHEYSNGHTETDEPEISDKVYTKLFKDQVVLSVYALEFLKKYMDYEPYELGSDTTLWDHVGIINSYYNWQ